MLEIQPNEWMAVARAEVGTKEIAGMQDNPRILEYLSATALRGPFHDEIPWCSAFVNWVMMQVGYNGTQSAAARSWLTWGEPLTSPRFGAILVLKRGNNTWQGHTGFECGENQILGGNQHNRVSIMDYDPARLLGRRWPRGTVAENSREPRQL